MKLFKTSTLLAVSAALLVAASAGAKAISSKDSVDTKGGSAVVTKFGDCVITKWDAKGGACNGLTSELRTVYFGFNSTGLTPAAKTKLNALAKNLKSSKVSSVKIVGFADEVGTENYNLRLSEKRAHAVAAYLRGRGITVSGKSEIRGLGETASQSSCSGQKGKALHACLWRDRRAEVEIVN